MQDLVHLRRVYGSVYVTTLPDGRHIPWKPLSIQDFLEYETLRKMGTYPLACLEDEIFRKCVLDTLLVDEMGKLKAGIVSTVASSIMGYSGPQGAEDLTMLLNMNRVIMQGTIHKLVRMVCMAFPSYKPEELYALDYLTLMQRVALAEDKLIETGLIEERLTFGDPGQQAAPAPEKKRPPADSSKLFDKYYAQEHAPPIPTSKSSKKQEIISNADVEEHAAAFTGHERTDKILLERDMVNDTAKIYADYAKQMKETGKINIPSHEERMQRAKVKAEANAEGFKQFQVQQSESQKETEKEEWERLLKEREKARARKARKQRK